MQNALRFLRGKHTTPLQGKLLMLIRRVLDSTHNTLGFLRREIASIPTGKMVQPSPIIILSETNAQHYYTTGRRNHPVLGIEIFAATHKTPESFEATHNAWGLSQQRAIYSDFFAETQARLGLCHHRFWVSSPLLLVPSPSETCFWGINVGGSFRRVGGWTRHQEKQPTGCLGDLVGRLRRGGGLVG